MKKKQKKDKLSLKKLQIAKITNPRMIIGGTCCLIDNGDITGDTAPES